MSVLAPLRSRVSNLLVSGQRRWVVLTRRPDGEVEVCLTDRPDDAVRAADHEVVDVVAVPDHVDHETFFALGQAERYERAPPRDERESSRDGFE